MHSHPCALLAWPTMLLHWEGPAAGRGGNGKSSLQCKGWKRDSGAKGGGCLGQCKAGS